MDSPPQEPKKLNKSSPDQPKDKKPEKGADSPSDTPNDKPQKAIKIRADSSSSSEDIKPKPDVKKNPPGDPDLGPHKWLRGGPHEWDNAASFKGNPTCTPNFLPKN